jgi:hypothetical protein
MSAKAKSLQAQLTFFIKITRDETAVVFIVKKVDSGLFGLSRSRERFFSCGLGIIILLSHKYI